MSADGLSLAAFLAARIAEDEAGIEHAIESESAPSGWLGPMMGALESHRSILKAAWEYSPELEHGDNGEWAFDHTLRILAGTYASHPDYRSEWAA
jgi:hypothetical protein